MTTTSSRSLLTLAVLAGTLALIPPSAEARRVGGGRSIGMSRSHVTSPSPAPSAHESNYSAPATRYGEALSPSVPAASSFRSNNYGAEVTRSLLHAEALTTARRNRSRAQTEAEQAAPVAYLTGESGASEDALRIIEASRQHDAQRQENNARAPRVADPRFARITDNVAPSRPCEFKPVMSDDDYIVCGANPPSFPASR